MYFIVLPKICPRQEQRNAARKEMNGACIAHAALAHISHESCLDRHTHRREAGNRRRSTKQRYILLRAALRCRRRRRRRRPRAEVRGAARRSAGGAWPARVYITFTRLCEADRRRAGGGRCLAFRWDGTRAVIDN